MLVIGAAVGGETAAALFFGAKRVDAIDLRSDEPYDKALMRFFARRAIKVGR